MSAWGSSFGPCSGGGGETVIVEAIREASILSATSATLSAQQLSADTATIASSSIAAVQLSATVQTTIEATT